MDKEVEYEPIRMRVINNTDSLFSQVSIIPCFNTPENPFLNVNPADTTSYKNYICGFHETLISATTFSDFTYKRNSLDFLLPVLPAGDYDCIITIKENLDLSAIIELSN